MERVAWALVAMGLVLRLGQYATNPSFRGDEAALALNVVQRTWEELLHPLDYNQAAPIGFLMLEKAAVVALGGSEYALRLPALLAGLLSVPLFWLLARRWLGLPAAVIALSLFAGSTELVRWSREAKQYSGDIAVTIALLLGLGVTWRDTNRLTWAKVLGGALLGATAVWFSHPAVFVLAGFGLVQAAAAVARRSWRTLAYLAAMGTVWALSFGAHWQIATGEIAGRGEMLDYWAGAFVPLPPRALEDLRSLTEAFFHLFSATGSFPFPGVAALPFIMGCWALATASRRHTGYLLAPLLLCLLASGLHRYPFSDRLILFLVPAALLLVGAGTWAIAKEIPRATWAAPLVIAVVAATPWLWSARYVRDPIRFEELRPVLSYLAHKREASDAIYVYYGGEPTVKYYLPRFGIREDECVWGISSRDDWYRYLDDIRPLLGKPRVWFLFSHICNWRGVNEGGLITRYLDRIGTRLDTHERFNAAAYLYDLRASAALSLPPRPETASPSPLKRFAERGSGTIQQQRGSEGSSL